MALEKDLVNFVPPSNFNPRIDTLYHYVPTKSVCLVFLILFSITTVLHLVQAIRFRTWYLIPTAVLAGTGEVIGWSGRFWSSLNGGTLQAPFLMQITCLIISPTPLLAGYFVLLGRVILLLGQEFSRLKHKWYTRIFLTADIVALVVQAAGGAMASVSSDPTTGGFIALGGIVFQLASLITYIAFAVEFLLRFHFNRPFRRSTLSLRPVQTSVRSPSSKAQISSQGTSGLNDVTPVSKWPLNTAKVAGVVDRNLFILYFKVQLLLLGMAFSITCIFIRAIYRTVELSGGWDGRVNSTQIYFNILDGTMILSAMFVLNAFHPGYLLSPTHGNLERVPLGM